MPQTLREIKDILSAAGLRPQKRLGQNFLIDGNLMTKIVQSAEVQAWDVVLEVGAGTASLTELLLDQAGWVVAVEVDRGLFRVLGDRLECRDRLTLVHADVLMSKSKIDPIVIQALQDALDAVSQMGGGGEPKTNLMLVANLPYHVASPLLIDLLLCDLPFSRYCISVQKEVADRITAQPSTKEYGPIGIVLQSCARIEKICRLPSQAFWPVPKVTSAALRLDIDLRRFHDKAQLQAFINLVRLAFSHRRKTLNYNLRQEYDEATAQAACVSIGKSPRDRAESLTVDQWFELFKQLNND